MNLNLWIYQSRRWVLYAILPALLVGILDYVHTAQQPKTYTTATTLYVQVPGDPSQPGSTDVYTSQALIPTYSQMISSPVIIDDVNAAMAKQYPGYNLAAHGLSVGGAGSLANSPNTQLMNIGVSDTIPARAKAAADTTAQVFIKKVSALQYARFKGSEKSINEQLQQEQANIQLVSQRIADYHGPQAGLNSLKATLNAYTSIYQTLLASSQQFGVNRDTALNGVKVFSPAYLPTSPVGPHPTRGAALAAFIALALFAGAVFAYDYFDDTARTPEEIEEVVGAPILGTVEEFNPPKDGPALVTARHARSPISEAYRIIRTNIQFLNVDHPPHSLLVTSSSPAEGKSTTAGNLANVFADAGTRVALVDGDLRRPSIHRYFGMERQDGLTNMLVGDTELNGYGQHLPDKPNLTLVASGPLPPRPADLLGSERMESVIKHIEADRDLVFVDSPPILAVTDAVILSTFVDGVILVVDTAKSKRRELKRAREAIEVVGGKIVGVVINRLNKRANPYYYYYYQHNYGYGYRYSYNYSSSDDAPRGGKPPAAPKTTEAEAQR